MNIVKISTPAAVSSPTGGRPATSSESPQAAVSELAGGVSSDSVSLSGHALLLSRVFGTDEAHYQDSVTPKGGDSSVLADYLTKTDRELLEKMYQYSMANNIDLRHVDALAEDLGSYRAFGKASTPTDLYDAQGHKLTMDFSASENAIAQRIKDNGLTARSSIDQGFLESELGGGGRLANLAFVEKVISAFSSDPGGATPTSSDGAPVGQYDRELSRFVVTASKDVELSIPVADYASVDGVGQWRTAELAAANGVQGGNPGKFGDAGQVIAATRSNVTQLLSMLEGFGAENNVDKRRIKELFDFFKHPVNDKDRQ